MALQAAGESRDPGEESGLAYKENVTLPDLISFPLLFTYSPTPFLGWFYFCCIPRFLQFVCFASQICGW